MYVAIDSDLVVWGLGESYSYTLREATDCMKDACDEYRWFDPDDLEIVDCSQECADYIADNGGDLTDAWYLDENDCLQLAEDLK